MSKSNLHPTRISRLQWLKNALTMVRTSSVTIAIFDIRALATGGNLAAEGEAILVAAVSRTTLVNMSIVSRYSIYLFIVPSEFFLRCIACFGPFGQWLLFSCCGMCARTESKQVGCRREIRNIQAYRAAFFSRTGEVNV